MASMVIYYSYGGRTKELAQALAAQTGAELFEVQDQKRPGMLKTFLVGCPKSLAMKTMPCRPLPNFAAFDRFTVMAPIWAGRPAPVINNVWPALPKGCALDVKMVSGGGSSAKDKIIAHIEAQGLKVGGYEDLR